MTINDLLAVTFTNDIEKLVIIDYETEDELLNVKHMKTKYETPGSKEDYIMYQYGKCKILNITPKMVNAELKLLVSI